MKIMREEIFGPVVAIAKFKDEEEVLELANDTTYGLAAGIFTKDYERAIRVTGALKAGTTWVNLFNFVHWSMPFGGYKESGIGRECGDAALENYTEIKTVYFNMVHEATKLGNAKKYACPAILVTKVKSGHARLHPTPLALQCSHIELYGS
ncbi:hypothetical protein LTR78_010920 [Recurvomyces mirabilis]|uniref:aldehyde dehydrogenase (NAD(+)) n=1 Tax=Recurvomyces mirabilis TaxID=574656 RepID=A0AAE0TM06_9PEZI|nr:hypothetical protein LTR78_010920 [Recurvomyces mirabilis]KAK5150246.1 hypothetical protein LTS14_010222 [Recurvomyces mirabilis]